LQKEIDMKVQKGLAVLATLSMMSLMTACNDSSGGQVSDRYQEGFNAGRTEGFTAGRAAGYDEGYDDGYADGDDAGYARAEVFFASATYNQGYTAGEAAGYDRGYDDGDADGYDRGYDHGYDDGYDDGSVVGGNVTAAYNDGYADGHDDGAVAGYDLGYTDGFDDGYDVGYDDGFDDGYYSLSVGPSKNLKGYANLLSLVHNDMFDYSKIKAPKKTSRGLVANGRLIFSETSTTVKDTLKKAAAVEQYLVVEMAKQVQGRFGLSAERSLKVAKAANHFRKYSTSRALTAEDTNAYASEIVGADIKAIERAYEGVMKGDASAYKSVLAKAAAKNEVSPEKMSDIISELFL
jgi:flagellar biosynthesis/type III secretory pathway protein FliH